MFNHLDYLHNLDASNKARSSVLDNVERSLLCNTVYLGFDLFECPNCDNESIVPHKCHSRFCNACGVKYTKQLAAKAVSPCLNDTHRHMVFTILESLSRIFREDRSRMSLLFVASRDTIPSIFNHNIYREAKRLGLKNTHYLYKDYRHVNQFGMITTLHTFGRDLKWNPHIHALVPEVIYNPELNDEKNSQDINGWGNYFMRYASRPAMAESRIIDYCREDNLVTWFYRDHKHEKSIS